MTGTAVTLSAVRDWSALAARWRDLETRSNPSFFQSWTWTGSLAPERFRDPVLTEARSDGRVIALALFNRTGRTLHLGETGDRAIDDIYIEFNGVLIESGKPPSLAATCLNAARSANTWLPRGLVLSGIETPPPGTSRVRAVEAPFADLSIAPFLDSRTANTRQQIRRSDRSYARSGPLTLERATTIDAAFAFLDALAVLHQASWTARGKPGAFANPFFRRFHRALIAEGFPRGEIDLLKISAGPRTVGYLYNFVHRGTILAYQSGFDYAGASTHEKPGLSAHYLAMRDAQSRGLARYHFLAGDGRYKRSLSTGADTLYWAEIDAPFSPAAWVRRARDRLAQRRRAG